MRLSHSRAVLLMVLVTFLWSLAGVVSRHLESARSFEVTFWRSAFTALSMTGVLLWLRGPAQLLANLRQGGWPLYVSGLCWTVMFTNFMLAITLTTVATVLVTLAIGPLVTALFARAFLHYRLPRRTWAAIAVAGFGIAWMFGRLALSPEAGASADGQRASALGVLVALAVPIAGAINWTVLQHLQQRQARDPQVVVPDMLPPLWLGALLSAAITLPLALPLSASAHDVGLLALLGVVQLTLPCLLVVQVAKVLSAPEVSLIGLLEVIFGVLLAWVGAGEVPLATTLTGGALVIGALLANEALSLRERLAQRLPQRLPSRPP